MGQRKFDFKLTMNDLISKTVKTIINPREIFTSEDLKKSLKYAYFVSFLIAIWYGVICLIMYYKADVDTHYFLFEAFWWSIFAILLIAISYYFPDFLARKIFNKPDGLNKKVTANIIGLSAGIPSIFIAIIDFIIVLIVPKSDVTNYALGNGMEHWISKLSTPVFSLVGLWLFILTWYGLKKISGFSTGKSFIFCFIVLAPILFLLFFFIALESVQPF